RFELRKAEERAHILEGLIIAVDNIDEVVRIIRASRTPADAQANLEKRFNLDNLQSKAIVDMRLSALTGLRIDELKNEYEEIEKLIAHLNELLANEVMRYELIESELQEVKDKYADERRTQIVKMATEFNPEDMYADDDMIITISHLGYIKRTPLTEFRQQSRGGIGTKASASRDSDFIEYVHQASMHSTMMLFTELGRLYWIKVYDLPEGNRQSKGRAIQNVINLQKGDRVCAFINVKGLNDEEFVNNHYLIFATKNGLMKKTTLEAYSRPRANGIIAIGLREGDELIGVTLTDGESQMLIGSYNGKVVRFPENTVRPMGRGASGVRAIKLDEDGEDRAIGMVCVEPNSDKNILVISEKGFGKRTPVDDEEGNPIYRITNRGGKGVKTIEVTDKTGKLIGIQAVTDEDDLMLMTKSGTAIRMDVSTIRVTGRAAQGVKLIELQKRNDILMSGCLVPKVEEEETPAEGAENAEAYQENTNENQE
ncbi:MAG: DNA gyrase subunit A, partial [Paludibacteraceae bacterium]|nr:DNA gyrase subunit A [Paludibacteraceae bacterium]